MLTTQLHVDDRKFGTAFFGRLQCLLHGVCNAYDLVCPTLKIVCHIECDHGLVLNQQDIAAMCVYTNSTYRLVQTSEIEIT